MLISYLTRLLSLVLLAVYAACALLFIADCAGAVLGVVHA